MKKLSILFTQLFLFISCSESTEYLSRIQDPELFQEAMQNLTDIVVYDIFSPPVASRVYLYPTLAAYEIVAHYNPDEFNSLVGQVKELKKIPTSDNPDINPQLAALFSFTAVGKTLIFSEDKMEAFQEDFKKKLKTFKVPSRVSKASEAYGEEVATAILEWASGDLYNQTRTFSKYTIREEDRYWKPTPPDYMDGIEPHWQEIRTMVLDSSNQFPPKDPLPFDLKKGSPFQRQLMEVFEVTNGLTEEEVDIAKFWDCNPYVTHHRGHAMFATKKITPGGHWIGITAIATRQAKSSFDETVNAYANVSIALFDAFISCWDEKWETLVVRPGGHSVISRAAAVTLTDLYGDNFKFTDTTELAYGLPERSYDSFIHASEEAAISRLYGGIHYRMAITEGVEQGQQVGAYIVNQIKTKKTP